VTDKRQFGIKTRLFFAFGAVAGTTVVASVAAWLLFEQIGGLMNSVATRNIPEVIATLELATDTQAVVASAPNLLNADTQERRQQQVKSLKELQAVVAKRLDAIAGFGGAQQSIDKLRQLSLALNEKLTALDAVVDARIAATAQRVAASTASGEAQKGVLAILGPALEKAQTDITMVSMTIGNDPAQSTMTLLKLVSREVPVAQGLADLVGFVNLGSGVLDRATLAPEIDGVEALRKDFKAVAEQIDEKLDIVDNLQPTDGLRKAVEALIAKGSGANNLFDARRKELEAQLAGRKLLVDTRTVAADLTTEVSGRAEAVRQTTKEATDRSDAAIGFGNLVMLAIATVSLVGAFLVVWLYIGRNLIARLTGLEKAMTRIAGGDLEVDVGATQNADEIGQMARALAVFRDGIVRANALAAEQAKEQEARQQRAHMIERLTKDFDDSAGTALGAVSAATADMKGTAEKMSSVAQQATTQTTAVATASAQAAVNVQTVAAATEELSGSISEIARQVAESAQIAGQAVSQVAHSQTTVTELAQAAQRIGEVVGLINSIAGQTNLLALNATIEAARAGEAGKGFAVVASEVKNLATQTAKATEGITAQVVAIQGSTQEAVDTIKGIGETISRIAEIATTIASAVEEQGAATQEIARNVQEAAAGTQDVSSHIVGVSEIAGESGKAADHVLASTARLEQESEALRSKVDSFLRQIKAA
jgi:methyl-accepting chemotaxis protein